MTLHRFACLVASATFLLLIAGGLVTSTDSGLAVPDWPLSYGTLFPPMVGGIRYEHTHRLIASAVGLLTFTLLIWILAAEKRRPVRWLGIASFGAVVLQGILGGLTVLFLLPAPISIAHAALGQTFFCVMVALAVVTGPDWQSLPSPLWGEGRGEGKHSGPLAPGPWSPNSILTTLSAVTFAAVFLQLILGAVLRHTHAGLGAHIGGAMAVVFCAGRLSYRLLQRPRDPVLSRNAFWLCALIGVQLALGLASISKLKSVPIVTAHVATGALILATSLIIFLESLRRSNEKISWKPGALRDASSYLELTKPRLTLLVVATTLTGFLMGSRGSLDGPRLGLVLFGTALLVGGANSLNQLFERATDAKMHRTRTRPLPSGKLSPRQALIFGAACSALGAALLWRAANPLTALLGLAASALYLFAYTPLKTRTPLCTLVGAVPGALPPVMGWAAAQGEVGRGAWILFVILFLWQLPHFLALCWTYREDYARAGFPMLAVVDDEGTSTGRQIVLYTLALLPVSLLPAVQNISGAAYFFGALALGIGFIWVGCSMARARSHASAQRLFLASVAYLPLLLTLMVLDKSRLG